MDYVASNASVHTHAPFPLVGDYAPNPTEHRTHFGAACSANTFEGYAKTPPPLQGCDESLHPYEVAIYHPIRRYKFPQKGVSKMEAPYSGR